MFQKIWYRLLASYLLVLALMLGGFVLAVRIVFTRSLTHQLTDKLTILGEVAIEGVEYDNGRIKLESDFSVQNFVIHHQALQWFDTQGHLLEEHGKDILHLPLPKYKEVQFQTLRKNRIQAVTLPIISIRDKKLIG